MSDPEIHEQLPLQQAKWVVSTVRSEEINLALIHLLRDNGYKGKIALTAINQREVERFRKEGAQVIFRPFADAAEQAADALAYAMDALPSAVSWPITFTELRVRSEAAIVGKKLENLPLQEELGASVLAVSRAGRPHYNPPPDFPIYPGDRLVLVGSPKALREAETRLHQLEQREEHEQSTTDCFEIAEIPVLADSSLANQSIAESHIRPTYGVTIIGIKRGDESITEIHPQDLILPDDTLIVVGAAKRIQSLRERALRDAKSI
jgi:Trk K+ transport system NAD-binding subunit